MWSVPDATGGQSHRMSGSARVPCGRSSVREALARVTIAEMNAAAVTEAFDEVRLGRFRAWMADAAR